MIKPKASSYFLIAILAITLAVFIYSLSFPFLKLKLLPLLSSGLVFVLGVFELTRELKKSRDTHKPKADEAQDDETPLRDHIIIFSWIVGFLLLIYLTGFIAGIGLFIFSYTKTHGLGWGKSFVLTAITVVILYALFVIAMQLTLFPGLIPEWIWG